MRTLFRYQLSMTGTCPVDGSHDEYQVAVISRTMITVERILKARLFVEGLTAFQENMTIMLAENLHAKVVTRGVHSGVTTTCVADARPV